MTTEQQENYLMYLMIKKDHVTDSPILKRNMCHRNITKFISEMDMVNWQFVLNKTDTQLAYSKFHEVISTKYNAFIPYHKISKQYLAIYSSERINKN